MRARNSTNKGDELSYKLEQWYEKFERVANLVSFPKLPRNLVLTLLVQLLNRSDHSANQLKLPTRVRNCVLSVVTLIILQVSVPNLNLV